MSRHKLVRDLDLDDYYDDDDEYYDEHPASPSVAVSPTSAQYIFQGEQSLSSFWLQPSQQSATDSFENRIRQVLDVVGDVGADLARLALEECEDHVESAVRYIAQQQERENFYQSENDLLFNSQMSGDIEEECKIDPPSTYENVLDMGSLPDFRAGMQEIKPSLAPRKHKQISNMGAALPSNVSQVSGLVPQQQADVPLSAVYGPTAANKAFRFDTPSPDTTARFRNVNVKAPTQKTAAAAALPPDALLEPDKPVETASPVPPKSMKLMSAAALKKRQERVNALIQSRNKASAANTKMAINMVVVGHVDAGKSTLMGHLLHIQGGVSQREMHKHTKESASSGKSSLAFAWLLDLSEEERARGVTVDIAVRHFNTDSRAVTLLDAPGHRDFIPAMISGAAQADTAILVVDASTGEFESGFSSSGQTKEHAILCRSLGVQQIILAINKLDSLHWSRERYEHIANSLIHFLKQTGFKEANLWPVPLSGLSGENLRRRWSPQLTSWYSGPTLLQLIDRFDSPDRNLSAPLRLAVNDAFRSTALQSLAVAGTIMSGCVFSADRVLLLPANEVVQIKGILKESGSVSSAVAGDRVELGLSGLSDDSVIVAGSVLCDAVEPVQVVDLFEAKIITVDMRVPIVKGSQLVLHMQSLDQPCTVRRLCSLTSKGGRSVVKQRPRCITSSCSAVVRLQLDRSVPLSTYEECRQLGRFSLRRQGYTVAVGLITTIIKK